MSRLKIIHACCDSGQNLPGVAGGPQSIMTAITHSPKKPKNISEIRSYFHTGRSYDILNRCTHTSLKIFDQTCILGGDHSITSASLPAFFDAFRDSAHVLWIDAHADINTPQTSPTGHTHGMPLSQTFRLADPRVPASYTPSFDQLTYIGLRSIDEGEQKIIDKYNIKTFSASDVNNQSQTSLDELLERVRDKNVYISFDVDGLDPTVAPSTGTAVPDGLLVDPIIDWIHAIKQEVRRVPCFDIVELNPLLGTKKDVDLTRDNVLRVLDTLVD